MTETPRYLTIKPQYLDDDYIEEGEIIEYAGVPNENLEPVNQAARDCLLAYLPRLEGGRTPPLEQTIYEQMLRRPKEMTSPELLALFARIAEAKAPVAPEDREKSYSLPERRIDVPQTGADPKAALGRRKAVIRHGQVPEDTSQKVRKVTGHSPATVA